MLERWRTISLMDMALILGRMEKNMLGNGKVTKKMGTVLGRTKMGNMLVNGKKMKSTDKDELILHLLPLRVEQVHTTDKHRTPTSSQCHYDYIHNRDREKTNPVVNLVTPSESSTSNSTSSII